jgi:hypothetical protein
MGIKWDIAGVTAELKRIAEETKDQALAESLLGIRAELHKISDAIK